MAKKKHIDNEIINELVAVATPEITPEIELTPVIEAAPVAVTAPAVTIKLARTVLRHLSQPAVRASMDDEMIYQTSLNRSDDFAEFRAARAESRPANYTGS